MANAAKTCLVTGGAGFIGRTLVETLLNAGHSVRVIDNLASGRRENVERFADRTGYAFVEADVADTAAIRPHFDGVDWVFHLAAMADIVPSIEAPMIYHRANVDGTISVLECAREAGCARFVYAASSSCYGIPDVYPTPETAPARPMYPYALTKYVGEQYVMHWAQLYDLPALSLRLFNVFGPGHRTTGTYGAVFGVFLAQKLAGEPFTIVGDGTQTRDFTYVTDVADAFITAARSDRVGEIYNVGSDGTYSVNHLVSLLDGPSVHIPKRPGEPDSTYADISRIKRDLGWQPRTAFDDGVRQLLEHIEEWRAAPVWTTDRIAKATEKWFQYLGKSED